MCINQLIHRALKDNKERGRYAYLAPFYKQSKQIAWDYLKYFTSVIPDTKYNESELRVDFSNGTRITLYGADNYDALRGIYLDGVILDEYAQMSPKAWTEVIRPALADREGWAIFIGTPQGHNSFYELYKYAESNEDWFSAMYKASETKVLPETELIEARRIMGEDEYNQEFECSFEAAIQGSYYGQLMNEARQDERVCAVPYEPHLPVHTAWDLGVGDATAIIFYQTYGKEIRIIDYEEHTGEGMAFYVDLLEGKDYNYGNHYMPHDIQVRELGTGKSRMETAQGLGLTPIIVVPKQNVDDGIQAVRGVFPRLWIEKELTPFIDAVTQYRKDFDDKKKVFKNHPLHDWTSHAADALRYLALSIPEERAPRHKKPKKQLIRRAGVI